VPCPAGGVLHVAAAADGDEFVEGSGTALLPLALTGGNLNQLTLNLLQLAHLSGKRMPALA
jgi:hypothetical protein